MSAIKDVYQKLEHLDELLSGSEWADASPLTRVAHDLWAAIKADVKADAARPQTFRPDNAPPVDIDSGAWVAMTMGTFISVLVDSSPSEAIIYRVVGDTRVNEEAFMRHLDVRIVPDGAVVEQIEATGARAHKVLSGAIERGLMR